MRLCFAAVLSFLLSLAAAGGIRGAYERLFIWYAYQAQLEHLRVIGDTKFEGLTICPHDYGTRDDGTLTFNEFIEVCNGEYEQEKPAKFIIDPKNLYEIVPCSDSFRDPWKRGILTCVWYLARHPWTIPPGTSTQRDMFCLGGRTRAGFSLERTATPR
jgi:hypothetical protein